MPEPILVQYTFTLDELLVAYRWHFRQRRYWMTRIIVTSLGALFFLYGARRALNADSSVIGGSLMICGAYLSSYSLRRRLSIKRHFERRPDKNSTVEWEVSEQGLKVRTANASSDMEWDAILRVIESPEGFLLYPIPNYFQWLPKAGTHSDADYSRLGELIREHIADYSRVGRFAHFHSDSRTAAAGH